MADEEQKQEIDDSKEEESKPDVGSLILIEMRTMNAMLGAINQNITSVLKPMQEDLERCKVNLSRIKKLSGQELTVAKEPFSSTPYVPPNPE